MHKDLACMSIILRKGNIMSAHSQQENADYQKLGIICLFRYARAVNINTDLACFYKA
ncbi:hypothetical protein SanaruYs_07260 [Chryseotalea sanaruensis]|uniref:Uncharacterized protein n=1 Tax=Chryseotalea sanaruensis TaxID=2482724 RepID=A0A401U6F4_9BACT|nr:hypothetical protein SanaruYs_07260 [Chryseotalea sanaruensis]